MNRFKESFEDVADWCERYLEKRHDAAIGMIFGTIVRMYGELATSPSVGRDPKRKASKVELEKRADGLLKALTQRLTQRMVKRQVGSYGKPVEASSARTNMVYDSRSHRTG